MSQELIEEVSVRFTVEDLKRIDRVRKAESRTRSNLIRWAVEKYCEQWECDNPTLTTEPDRDLNQTATKGRKRVARGAAGEKKNAA